MGKRFVSLSALFLLWFSLLLGFPIWAPIALVIGIIRRCRMVVFRLGLFLIVFTTMEVVGVVAMGAMYLIGRAGDQTFHHRLQSWWASTLFRVVCGLLELRVDVSGDGVLREGPYLLLMRHSSLADTLLPAALVGVRHRKKLRYVLKQELRADPCLDICGGRLPNHFVDRKNPNEAELEAIAALALNLDEDEVVLIYPEGTRFSNAKRKRRIEALRQRGAALLEEAAALEMTLPPRIRGVAALRSAAPDADIVICAHHGFEGFRSLSDVLSGNMVGRTLSVGFWRAAAVDIPRDDHELLRWLYGEWADVDRFVRAASPAS